MTKMFLEIGISLRDCATVARFEIKSKSCHQQEVHGVDTMSFELYCGCSTKRKVYDEIETYRFARVIRYVTIKEGGRSRQIEEEVMAGYICAVSFCTKPKWFTYKITVGNHKKLLQEYEIGREVTNPRFEEQPLLNVGQMLFLLEESISRCLPLSNNSNTPGLDICIDGFDQIVVEEKSYGCKTTIYDYLDDLATQANALWYTRVICNKQTGGVYVQAGFTECIGEDKTGDRNSRLYLNGRYMNARNTITDMCVAQKGGGVTCIVVNSTVIVGETDDGDDIIENIETIVSKPGPIGLLRCIDVDNTDNTLFTPENAEQVMTELGQAELDRLCDKQLRYDLTLGKNTIGANIGDKVRLVIEQTKRRYDVTEGAEVTVLSKKTTYKKGIAVCDVTVGSPSIDFVSKEQIRRNLAGLGL